MDGVEQMDVERNNADHPRSTLFSNLMSTYMQAFPNSDNAMGIPISAVIAVALTERYDVTQLQPVLRSEIPNRESYAAQLSKQFEQTTRYYESTFGADSLPTSTELDRSTAQYAKFTKNYAANVMTPVEAFNSNNADQIASRILESEDNLVHKCDKTKSDEVSNMLSKALGVDMTRNSKSGVDGIVQFEGVSVIESDPGSYIPLVIKHSPHFAECADSAQIEPDASAEFFRHFDADHHQSILIDLSNKNLWIERFKTDSEKSSKVLETLAANVQKLKESGTDTTSIKEKIYAILQSFDPFENSKNLNERQLLTEYVIGKFCTNASKGYEKYFPTFHGITWTQKAENDHTSSNFESILTQTKQLVDDSVRRTRGATETAKFINILVSDKVRGFDESHKDVDVVEATTARGSCEYGSINRYDKPKIVMSDIARPFQVIAPTPQQRNRGDVPSQQVNTPTVASALNTLFNKSTNTVTNAKKAVCLILDCMTQLPDALKNLQQNFDFIHGDLHADNVMFVQYENIHGNTITFGDQLRYHSKRCVEIIDFGRSKATFGDIVVHSGSIYKKQQQQVSTNNDIRSALETPFLKEFKSILIGDTVNQAKSDDITSKSVEMRRIMSEYNAAESKVIAKPYTLQSQPKFDMMLQFSEGNMSINKAPSENVMESHDIYHHIVSSIFLCLNTFITTTFTSTRGTPGHAAEQDKLGNTFRQLQDALYEDETWFIVSIVPPIKNNTTIRPAVYTSLKTYFHYLALAAHVSSGGSKHLDYTRTHFKRVVSDWFRLVNSSTFSYFYEAKKFGVRVTSGNPESLSLAAIVTTTLKLRQIMENDDNYFTDNDIRDMVVIVFKNGPKSVDTYVAEYFEKKPIKDKGEILTNNDENVNMVTELPKIFDKRLLPRLEEDNYNTALFVTAGDPAGDLRRCPTSAYLTLFNTDKLFTEDEKRFLDKRSFDGIVIPNVNELKMTETMEPFNTGTRQSKLSEDVQYIIPVCVSISDYARVLQKSCYPLVVYGNRYLKLLKRISEMLDTCLTDVNLKPGILQSLNKLEIREKLTNAQQFFTTKTRELLLHVTNTFTPGVKTAVTSLKRSKLNDYKSTEDQQKARDMPFYFLRHALTLLVLSLNLNLLTSNEYDRVLALYNLVNQSQ